MMNLVTSALAAIQPGGTFATELSCPSGGLRIQVDGVGALRFPVTDAAVRKLCLQARPAPFGKRDRTLYDRRVRDGWELPASKIAIDEPLWQRTLGPALAIVQQRLGLPVDGRLEAEFDKLLVYRPGQFFATHQDSERSANMFGTLVVELPSAHEGGTIVVEHLANKLVFLDRPLAPTELGLVAFYADCRHQVTPVRSGDRVVLTYRLRYIGKRPARRKPAPKTAIVTADVDRLADTVKAYFETPISTRYSRSAPERPDRLVYLLDHEYTQKSLDWKHLKNGDRLRVDALRQTAERLDYEAYLALADVHESWSCGGDEGYGRWSRYEPKERDPDDYELQELIASDVELRHWVSVDGRIAESGAVVPATEEICSTRESGDLTPFKSEHEGYMGNYGNTVDRWFHRAAFVMWPRAKSFVLRAKVSPAWAVKQIASRIKAGAVVEARTRAQELLPFWKHAMPDAPTVAFVRGLFEVGLALDDAAIASGLLAPLAPHLLTPGATPAFVAVVEHYGLAWSQRMFDGWIANRRWNAPPWLPSLPRLAEAAAAAGKETMSLVRLLLTRQAAAFREKYDAMRATADEFLETSAARDHDELLGLLEGAAAIGAPTVRDELLAFLTAPEHAMPPLQAGALLEACRKTRTPAAVRALGLGRLHRHLVASLERILAAPPRSPDDWSIEPPPGCDCALCKRLAAFLVDPARIEERWPLAKEGRKHIHRRIEARRLPVTHDTLRIGSPQTLVLEKQEELFKQAAALCARQRALLSWLKKEQKAFTDAPKL
jgi:hypothetical protein